MAFNLEYERHIRVAQHAKDEEAVELLKAQQTVFNSLVKAGRIKELPFEMKRFTHETREALEKQGYVFYGLTGESIKTEREAGRSFWTTWHNKLPDFEALSSIRSEVAINLNAVFLPESNNKKLSRQEALVEKFSQEFSKKVPGVKAVIGNAPDYVELAFQHLDLTGNRLFLVDYVYARTKTPIKTNSLHVAGVGFSSSDNLGVSNWPAGRANAGLYAAPLVVPA